MKKIIFILFSFFLLLSCSNSKSEDIIKIIDSFDEKLYETKSKEELTDLHFSLLDSLKQYLNENNNGQGLIENDEEYEKIIDRLDLYNISFCGALGRYNPSMQWSPIQSENHDIAEMTAIMKVMENRILTDPNGTDFKKDNSLK